MYQFIQGLDVICLFDYVQDVDYEGFKAFFNLYLEQEAPDELCRHLFLSFVKRPPALPESSPLSPSSTFPDGKAIQVMRMLEKE